MNNEGTGCGAYGADDLSVQADATKDEDFLNGNKAGNANFTAALTALGDGYMKNVVER